MASVCDISEDQKFGPTVGCQFDFTLYFEQSIFGIGVTSLFLLFIPLRFSQVYRADIKTLWSPIYVFKIAFSIFVLGTQLACLVLWVKHPITNASVAAAAIEFVTGLGVLALGIFEHSRTIRPSSLVFIFLLCSIVGDSVQIRTLAMRDYVPVLTDVTSAGLACKVLLMILETWPKTSYLKPINEKWGKEEVASHLNRSIFWWINPILLRGNRQLLSQSDVFELDHELYSRRMQGVMHEAWIRNKHKKTYPFVQATISYLRWQLLLTIPPRAAMIGFNYSQTFLINSAIKYLAYPPADRNVNHAYGLVGATVLIYGGIALNDANFYSKVYRIATAFRGATCSLIYTKSLSKLSAYNEMAAVTLMSTDVDRMVMSFVRGSELWARITEVGIGLYLLYRQLGAVSVAPIVVVLFCFCLTMWIASFMASRQAKWVKAVQRRVAIASTVLRSMKSIKLSGLVDSMAELLQSERVRELNLAKDFRWLQTANFSVMNLPTILASLVVLGAYAIKAEVQHTAPLSIAQAFTSFSIVALLTGPASQLLGDIPLIISGMGCVQRVEKFLLFDDFDDNRDMSGDDSDVDLHTEKPKGSMDHQMDLSDGPDNAVISVRDLDLGISEHNKAEGSAVVVDESKIASISFEATRGTLTTILGPVGCGKSTLLRTLLGELKPKKGRITISTPFIGYCPQAPWLPNSRVRDAIVGANEVDEEWYQQIIELCALRADFGRMPQNDLTIMGARGIVLSGGQKHRISLARALYSRCPILILDDFLSSLDRKTRHSIADGLWGKNGHIKRHGITVILATHTTSYVNLSDSIVVFGPGGSILYTGSPHDWKNPGTDIFKAGNNDASEEKPSDVLSKQESEEAALVRKQTLPEESTEETIKRQEGDWRVWVYYGRPIGIPMLIVTIIIVAINAFLTNFPKLWLQWSTGSSHITVGIFVGVYAMSCVLTIGFTFWMIYLFLMVLAVKSAIVLHKVLVQTAFAAPMSYYEVTDSSILLNRFSQDMSLIDMQLPMSAFMFISSVFMCIMAGILICLGSSYIAAVIPGILLLLWLIQKFYLRTSRQVRLLDLEAKSPLYQHFTETLEGVETIRAFGWAKFFDDIAIKRLDDSQRPYYLLFMIQRWLMLVLDLVVASIGILLVALALCVPKSSSAGALGVALTSILAFNMSLKGLIMSWTMAETSLGSVARTESFEKFTPTEIDPDENLDPGTNWPLGNIEVLNMHLAYRDGTVALKNVSCSIKAGQKVGICGRTGSGKSTLLSSFLRLIDPSSGTILIDGIDIGKVPRNTVRDRLICLPQDALVFQGTFRFNLDPLGHVADDAAIISVLTRVRLIDLVERRGGIAADLKPESLSHGEQQLLALARAILRKQVAGGKSILVLDEATSNLDPDTEKLIQSVIDEEFGENTVLIVAHRLDTVRGADFIIMLEKGEVIKVGTPAEVL